MNSGWCTIESDPGVFTELIQSMGVVDVQVEEVYTLSPESFQNLGDVYGLIFLFKWSSEGEPEANQQSQETPHPQLFFAKQVISNACATQALLSVLLNNDKLELGQALSQFREFTSEFPPELKGEAIGNLDQLRNAHNSFARPEPFVSDGRRNATKDDDVFHFVAYIPFKGKVYELDGLQPAPRILEKKDKKTDPPLPKQAKIDPQQQNSFESDWIEIACERMQEKISLAKDGEIRFNLMCLCQDQRVKLKSELTGLNKKVEVLEKVLNGEKVENSNDGSEFSGVLASGDKSKQENYLGTLKSEVYQITTDLQSREKRFEDWKKENIRRKHNYVPFVVKLCHILAGKEKLEGMAQKARENRESQERQKSTKSS